MIGRRRSACLYPAPLTRSRRWRASGRMPLPDCARPEMDIQHRGAERVPALRAELRNLRRNLLINGLEVAREERGGREGERDDSVNPRCNLALRRSSNSNCQQQLSRLNTLGSRSCNLHARAIVAARRTHISYAHPRGRGGQRRGDAPP